MNNSFTKFSRIPHKADARLLIGSGDVANRHIGAPMRGLMLAHHCTPTSSSRNAVWYLLTSQAPFIIRRRLVFSLMLPRIFKRSDTKKQTAADNHQVFLNQYNALKSSWLQEQKNANSLSSDEQHQISLIQNNVLKVLINNLRLDEAKYLREYPVPTLTDNDMNLDLQPFEKELD
uniref:Restriction endonuclease subunit S n=1 Tax=Strongyloides papillosus TaxID=174720 RepID=A0A0N5CGX2_STREA